MAVYGSMNGFVSNETTPLNSGFWLIGGSLIVSCSSFFSFGLDTLLGLSCLSSGGGGGGGGVVSASSSNGFDGQGGNGGYGGGGGGGAGSGTAQGGAGGTGGVGRVIVFTW